MHRQLRLQMFTVLVAALAAGLFHLASPLAVSAQSSATMRVTVTVVPAGGIWAAQELSQGLVEELAGQQGEAGRAFDDFGLGTARVGMAATSAGVPVRSLRREQDGAVAWVEPVHSGAEHTSANPAHAGDCVSDHASEARITVAHLAN